MFWKANDFADNVIPKFMFCSKRIPTKKTKNMASYQNSQSNTAPKPCKKCNNYAKSGPKCTKCGIIFHRGCVKYIKDIVIKDESSVICCSDGDQLESTLIDLNDHEKSDLNCSFLSATDQLDIENVSDSKIMIAYLKDIIKHKNFIIRQLLENINLLKHQHVTQAPSIKYDDKLSKEVIDKTDNVVPVLSQKDVCKKAKTLPLTKDSPRSTVSNQTPSSNRRISPQKRQMSSFNLNGDNGKKTTIIGTFNTEEVVSVKNKYWLFATKYNISYTKDKLKEHLDSIFPDNESIVEELPIKTGFHYRSFKIGVDISLKERVFKEEVWPAGVEVSVYNFFWKSRNTRRPWNRSHVPSFQARRRR